MQIEKPFSRAMSVKEPTKFTEFEIQAFLYSELRSLGLNVRGEVKTLYSIDGSRFGKNEICRFDLVQFVDGQLVGILEVKAAKITHKTELGWQGTRQGKRYHEFGVPVRIVFGMDEAYLLVQSAKKTGEIPWG